MRIDYENYNTQLLHINIRIFIDIMCQYYNHFSHIMIHVLIKSDSVIFHNLNTKWVSFLSQTMHISFFCNVIEFLYSKKQSLRPSESLNTSFFILFLIILSLILFWKFEEEI